MHHNQAEMNDVANAAETTQVVVTGTGLYIPPETISNAELVASFNRYADLFNARNAADIEAGKIAPVAYSSEEFIEKASGIKSRYVMDKTGVLDPERMCPIIPERSNEEPSIQCEIGVAAAREALERAGRTAADVDLIIVACSNLQRAYPAVALEIQEALGIEGFGYDMNVACSSATFGMQNARDAIVTGAAKCVLMINPEITSGHLAWQDRDCHFIFGDVCTATVIENAATAVAGEQWEIVGTRMLTRFSSNIRNNFGYLNRCDERGIGARDKLFMQQGRKVFKEVVPMVAQLIGSHLDAAGVAVGDIRRFWLHQANLAMNQLIAHKVLGRDATVEEAPVVLDEFANTSSAGTIIAFHRYRHDLAPGDIGVICSFGAGYSAGSVIVRRLR